MYIIFINLNNELLTNDKSNNNVIVESISRQKKNENAQPFQTKILAIISKQNVDKQSMKIPSKQGFAPISKTAKLKSAAKRATRVKTATKTLKY